MPVEAVQAEVKKVGAHGARSSTRVIAGEQGAQRSVVVERRVVRKIRQRQAHRHLEPYAAGNKFARARPANLDCFIRGCSAAAPAVNIPRSSFQ
jgi:hypothetical protein